jgi:hypothetical protein
LGAAGYAYYQSSFIPKDDSGPARIIDGRTIQPNTQVSQFPAFTMHAGKTDSDGLPTSNARICVKAESQCFALSTDSDGSRLSYFFGLDPKSERVAIDSGGSMIFFSGTFSAGGSGLVESFALLQYDSNGQITNILPKVLMNDGGDRRVWRLRQVSPMPVTAFAEQIWGEGEAHYGDRHLFNVSAYVFDAQTRRYTKRVEYTTSQKYSDDDNGKPNGVLESEKPNIIKRLTGVDGQSNVENDGSTQVAPVPRSAPTKAESDAVNRQLSECILPKVQYGQYSSYDGTKSVLSLEEQCAEPVVRYEEQCEASGHSERDCTLQLAILMKAAMRMFNK